MTIKEIGEILDKKTPFKFAERVSVKNIAKENFIKREIFKLMNDNATYYPDGSLQCTANRWRSIGDMYIITKQYYPEITFSEYVKIFYEDFKTIINEDSSVFINDPNAMYIGQWCTTVMKRTFRLKELHPAHVLYNVLNKDEWDKTILEWLKEIKEIVD